VGTTRTRQAASDAGLCTVACGLSLNLDVEENWSIGTSEIGNGLFLTYKQKSALILYSSAYGLLHNTSRLGLFKVLSLESRHRFYVIIRDLQQSGGRFLRTQSRVRDMLLRCCPILILSAWHVGTRWTTAVQYCLIFNREQTAHIGSVLSQYQDKSLHMLGSAGMHTVEIR
jgi:hypothetical protein